MKTWILTFLTGVLLLSLAGVLGRLHTGPADAGQISQESRRGTSLPSEVGASRHSAASSSGSEVLSPNRPAAGPGRKLLDQYRSELRRRTDQAQEEDQVGILIASAADSPDPDQRVHAISLLASAKPTRRVLLACAEALLDEDPEVRLTAVLAFDDFKDAAALPLLLEIARSDPSPEVRETALDVYYSLSDRGSS